MRPDIGFPASEWISTFHLSQAVVRRCTAFASLEMIERILKSFLIMLLSLSFIDSSIETFFAFTFPTVPSVEQKKERSFSISAIRMRRNNDFTSERKLKIPERKRKICMKGNNWKQGFSSLFIKSHLKSKLSLHSLLTNSDSLKTRSRTSS